MVLANVALEGSLCNLLTIANTFPNLIDDTFPTKKVFFSKLWKVKFLSMDFVKTKCERVLEIGATIPTNCNPHNKARGFLSGL